MNAFRRPTRSAGFTLFAARGAIKTGLRRSAATLKEAIAAAEDVVRVRPGGAEGIEIRCDATGEFLPLAGLIAGTSGFNP